ncbi:hypothetical protein [Marinibactrum halimedae]|uniref:Flagellar protein FliT n=1 Tax=Marinibactrum halimedae TaxID=1444977 RepID=A0AA37WPV4_9GAMM|nr:hypothetical protein [Marinibactrum halimedae]MCD9460870.1 hypothetical protein [Marinibactrum halimedae]GLS27351.1 hypothetical protein GCM10007877_30700 [Marinibactrum halimedae]
MKIHAQDERKEFDRNVAAVVDVESAVAVLYRCLEQLRDASNGETWDEALDTREPSEAGSESIVQSADETMDGNRDDASSDERDEILSELSSLDFQLRDIVSQCVAMGINNEPAVQSCLQDVLHHYQELVPTLSKRRDTIQSRLKNNQQQKKVANHYLQIQT